MDTIGYTIQPHYLFSTLATEAKQNVFQLSELNQAFMTLSTSYSQFNGLFDDVDLQSNKLGKDDQQRNIVISDVIKKLDSVDVVDHDGDVIGDAYEYLISEFASSAGKKAGEFYTPKEVSDMMSRIVSLGQEDKRLFSVFEMTMQELLQY